MVGHSFRLAVRRLRNTPGFCATVTLTLGLAIGGAGALLSLLHVLLLRPLPIERPDRLVAISAEENGGLFGISMPVFAQLADEQQALEGICALIHGVAYDVALERGASRPRVVETIAGDCYGILGIVPALGRLLTAADAPPLGDSARIAVISHRLWQEELGGSANVLGRSLWLEGTPLTIVGVLPDSYRGVNLDEAIDVAIPLPLSSALRGHGNPIAMHILGRLRDGVTLDAAAAHLRSLWPGVWREAHPTRADAPAGRAEHLQVVSAAHGLSRLRERYQRPLVALLALSGLLVLLACSNVGGLFLARALDGERTFAVQLALGAGRGRLVLQIGLEGVLLALGSGLIALPMVFLASRFVATTLWTGVRPLSIDVTPDAATLAMIAVATIVVGLLVSVPAILALRVRSICLAGSHGRGVVAATAGGRGALLAGQLAFSLVLLTTAALFVSSLNGLRRIDVGVQRAGLIWAQLDLASAGSQAPEPADYLRRLIDRAGTVPGIEQAAVSTAFPRTSLATAESRTLVAPHDGAGAFQIGVLTGHVTPGFFATAGIAMRAGRDFDWSDGDGRPRRVILSAAAADRLFGGEGAVGRAVRLQASGEVVTVLGVAANTAPGDPRLRDVPFMYLPVTRGLAIPVLVMRARAMPPSIESLQSAVGALHVHQVLSVGTVDDAIDEFLVRERILSALSAAFAICGIIVGAVGLFALLAHSVVRRRRELGVRMAVGAPPRAIVAMVMRQGVALVVAGLLAGLPFAVFAGRTARDLIPEAPPASAAAFLAAIGAWS